MRKKFSMNINKYHVNSDVQTLDKAFDMIFKANWLEAKTIIFRYFLARYRNFLPQVDQKVHQVLQNLPQAFCIGDVIRYDSIKPKKTIKSKICKIIIKLYISENLFKK